VIPGGKEQGLQSAAEGGFGPASRSLLAASDRASIHWSANKLIGRKIVSRLWRR